MKIRGFLLLWILVLCGGCRPETERQTENMLRSFSARPIHGEQVRIVLIPLAGNKLMMEVIFATGKDAGVIKYSDVKVTALDQGGKEMPVTPVIPELSDYVMPRDKHYHGSYDIALGEGSKVGMVKIAWKGDEQKFLRSELRGPR